MMCIHVVQQYFHPYIMYIQLIVLRKSDCLWCAVLLCLVVCLTLLASFFLPSESLIKACINIYTVEMTAMIYVQCVHFTRLCIRGQ